jgi:outer membrane autotransporter protein
MKKKILFVLSLISIISSSTISHAKDGFFVGLDYNLSNARHNFRSSDGNYQNASEDRSSSGYGVSAGYQYGFGKLIDKSLEKLYIAPEIFYDKIGTTGHSQVCLTTGDQLAGYCRDKMEVNSRRGAKINLGYEVFDKTNFFVNTGISSVNWHQRFLNGYDTEVTKLTSLKGTDRGVVSYGFGVSYDLSDNFILRTSYDISKFRTGYRSENVPVRDVITLKILKIGLVYKF